MNDKFSVDQMYLNNVASTTSIIDFRKDIHLGHKMTVSSLLHGKDNIQVRAHLASQLF